MISLDTPLSGLDGSCLKDFWQLPVNKKEFGHQPEYYFGQIVFHKMQVDGGEILHPVKIIGAWWTGMNWEYAIDLPPSHPKFEREDCEILLYVEDWQLEAM